MSYAIVNGAVRNKLYLKSVDRGMCVSWDNDGLGQLVCKVKRIPKRESGKEKGIQIVGRYVEDLKQAKKFQTRDKAEQMIREYPVLRFCRVEEV